VRGIQTVVQAQARAEHVQNPANLKEHFSPLWLAYERQKTGTPVLQSLSAEIKAS
jgi:hypothetical protein